MAEMKATDPYIWNPGSRECRGTQENISGNKSGGALPSHHPCYSWHKYSQRHGGGHSRQLVRGGDRIWRDLKRTFLGTGVVVLFPRTTPVPHGTSPPPRRHAGGEPR